MRHIIFLLLAGAATVSAEVHSLTLQEAISRSLTQSPEIALARLDEQQARSQWIQARDPFETKVVVGSGLAYTSGFPLSIEGSAPSILQAKAIRSLYNRAQSYRIAQRRQDIETAGYSIEKRRQTVASRVAQLWLDANYLGRLENLASERVENLKKVQDWAENRVEGGRALPVEAHRAALRVAQAEHDVRVIRADRLDSEGQLANVLGYPTDDRVAPSGDSQDLRVPFETPGEATAAAIEASPELRRLRSSLAAKALEVKSAKAEALPKVDLVAQYALLGQYNNYADFFNRFERHNYQFGASFQLPLLRGSAFSAQEMAAQAAQNQLQIQFEQERDRLSLEIQRLYRDLAEAESAANVARLDLQVAQEEYEIAQARLEEGKVVLRDLEEQRFLVSQKTAALEDAQRTLQKARVTLLEETGRLVANP